MRSITGKSYSFIQRIGLALLGLVCCAATLSAQFVAGETWRCAADGIEMIVFSRISPMEGHVPVAGSKFEVCIGDELQFQIYMRNTSDKDVRLITAPEFGFTSYGDRFSYAVDPELLDGQFVRIAESRLDIVTLKPGEVVNFGQCAMPTEGWKFWSREVAFTYRVSKRMADEYGVQERLVRCVAKYPLNKPAEIQAGE